MDEIIINIINKGKRKKLKSSNSEMEQPMKVSFKMINYLEKDLLHVKMVIN